MTAAPARPAVPWSEDRARKIAKTVSAHKLPLFSAWRGEMDVEDLFSEALNAIRQNHHKFNPATAKYSTFAYLVASRRVIDLWRARGRRANHEMAFRQNLAPAAVVELDDRNALGEMEFPDWLAQVFQRARRAYRPGIVRRGRKWFSVPQCATAVLLMQRLDLSCRRAADLLAERPELRRAMRMTRAPSYVWFFRAKQVVRRMQRNSSRSRLHEARSNGETKATPTRNDCAS